MLYHLISHLSSLFPKTLLLCHKRGPLSVLPRDTVILIVAALAQHYNSNPFSECPFPEVIKAEEEKKEDDE